MFVKREDLNFSKKWIDLLEATSGKKYPPPITGTSIGNTGVMVTGIHIITGLGYTVYSTFIFCVLYLYNLLSNKLLNLITYL